MSIILRKVSIVTIHPVPSIEDITSLVMRARERRRVVARV
jgi:hypothetical protein